MLRFFVFVLACVLHWQVSVRGIPVELNQPLPGYLNGWTTISSLDRPINMIAPTVSSTVGESAYTDGAGCATFPDFKFLDGSSGCVLLPGGVCGREGSAVCARSCVCACRLYALEWRTDDVTTYTGPHVLVNYAVPDFSPMAFITGSGPLVTLWYVTCGCVCVATWV